MVNILFIGDINGRPGRDAVNALLPGIIRDKEIDYVIANGENSAAGFGITAEVFNNLISMGIDCVTTGNHIWDKRDIIGYIDMEPRLLRPNNLPPGNPGKGYGIFPVTRNGKNIKIGVLNLVGRIFMNPVDCPFRSAEAAIAEIKKETKIIFVDMHAEATSEKQALAFFLDGRVSAVLGTHTHVQTADERILNYGTGYLTDAGMTGPMDSVIGVEKEIVIQKFLTSMPVRFEIAKNEVYFCGAALSIDETTGKTTKIERIYQKA
jgi:metallophosphoesterase (TIGR00282 family)